MLDRELISNLKLKISNLTTKIGSKVILQNISLTINPGELHVLMGPNGSGKSTLALEIIKKFRLKGNIFMGFQQPVTVPGVNYNTFLRLASKTKLGPVEFYKLLLKKAKILNIPEDFLTRSLNDNFSGGEKKKMELFQALVLNPQYAILDEPDAGVDIDTLILISKGIRLLLKSGTGILLITHTSRLLKYQKPNYVHILKNGKIITGKKELVNKVEKDGYLNF